MKFINNSVELGRTEATLIGVDAGVFAGWDELWALHGAARAAYDTEIALEWHSVETFLRTDTPMEDVLGDRAITSFDNWAIGRMVVFLEQITTEK